MRRLLLAAVLLTAMTSAPPAFAGAAAHWPIVGFGEQRSSVFSNEHWTRLGLKHTRLVVGWDALRHGWQRREIDAWMSAASQAGARPLVAFTRSRAHWRTRVLPTPAQYRRQFRRFRARYPWVRTYLVWNEANHCSQPTCHRPDRAARYFDVVRSVCPGCTVVAADVLDTDDMVGWLRAFTRAARHKPRIWGLHNYLDANQFRRTGTRRMLRAVRGRIWFTETGGLVERGNNSPHRFPDSPRHAARATRWVLERLAPMSRRIQRVYLYHFQHPGRSATWDSGVIDHRGRPRPAYAVIRNYVARARRARRAGR